jgi:hypothetical protein
MITELVQEIIPDYIRDNDSYRDNDGKGFVERYLEIFGQELDEEYYAMIEEDVFTDLFNPLEMDAKFLDYVAYALGDIPTLTFTEASYRRLLTYLVSIWKIKGTKRSFIAILLPLRAVVTEIEEIVPLSYTYDAGHTYDQPGILYDKNCPQCSQYNITITSILPLTADYYNKILDAIALVEPINAQINEFTFNGDAIDVLHIEVEVDENGDLVYDNDADPSLILTLDEHGNLHISGPNAARYFMEDGDLYFIDF